MRECTRECVRACAKWGHRSRGTGEERMKPRKERADGGEERRRKRKRKQQKGRRFEKPPSFCIMSVNAMLFLGGEGVKS